MKREKNAVYWKDLAAFKAYVTIELAALEPPEKFCQWAEAKKTWDQFLDAKTAAAQIARLRKLPKETKKTLWPKFQPATNPISASSSTETSPARPSTQADEATL